MDILSDMEHRDERVILETSRYRVTGIVRLPRDGYRSRLSDYLNSAERSFIPLTDVELTRLDGTGSPQRRAFVALSSRHIVMAMPDDRWVDDAGEDARIAELA